MDVPTGDKTGATQGWFYVKIRQTESLQIIKVEQWHQEQWWLWKNPAARMPEVESVPICAQYHNSVLTFSHSYPSLKPSLPSSESLAENITFPIKELWLLTPPEICLRTVTVVIPPMLTWGTQSEPVPLKWATELLFWSSSAQNYPPFENVFFPS